MECGFNDWESDVSKDIIGNLDSLRMSDRPEKKGWSNIQGKIQKGVFQLPDENTLLVAGAILPTKDRPD